MWNTHLVIPREHDNKHIHICYFESKIAIVTLNVRLLDSHIKSQWLLSCKSTTSKEKQKQKNQLRLREKQVGNTAVITQSEASLKHDA